ncbi:hypothetical protein F511_06573 [Dorcoceras hygrometricum]|uniref:Uncharacterized protein n=1 Tax=Dorcoceras hygrometricum TaxID=472368 RepID=A0A2Z7C3P1_9LAMI|nr:hypothetical protein F511_06573 [Dorcoceras hygrometricum]
MVGEATEKRKSKSTKKSSSADNTLVKVISEVAGSKKRVATEDIAPVIPTKRRTVKTKHSSSQASLDIMPVAQDVVPIQVIDPTPAAAAIKSPALKRKSRKRRLVLTTGSDDETLSQQELVKDIDKAAAKTSEEVDIIIEQVLEETLLLGVSEEEHGGQGVDEAAFADDFAQWLDDFVARNTEPEIVETRNVTSAADSTSPVTVQEMNKAVNSSLVTEENMSFDDLLLQISDDMLLPSISAPEISKIRLGESVSITEVRERDVYLTSLPRISTHDKGKAILDVKSKRETYAGVGGDRFVSNGCEDKGSPASSPATYQPQESSSSYTDVSMHFDSTDVPLNAQADTQASAPVDFTMFTDALEDLRSSISQRIHDSNSEILSKVNAVEIGVREALFKQHVLLRQSLQDACRVLERQCISQEMQINDLKKGLLAPFATVFQDLMAIKKGQREQDAKITALDAQIAAIRIELLDFQSKIAADILSLSTQIGDIADYIRGGDAKKGEIGGSSRRPPPVRVERRPLPTPTNQGESSSSHGRVLSVEEAAEMVREADRQADRRER